MFPARSGDDRGTSLVHIWKYLSYKVGSVFPRKNPDKSTSKQPPIAGSNMYGRVIVDIDASPRF
jgi:hypothetical protein